MHALPTQVGVITIDQKISSRGFLGHFWHILGVMLVFFLMVHAIIPPHVFSEQSVIVVATYEGVINPVAAEYLHDTIKHAETQNADMVIFQLDTPGGLDTSMRSMIKDIIGSEVPIVVYVSPSGGRAASAGVFITVAAHIAAMAEGTNIGAAHPVAMGGKKMDAVMKEKVENDSIAYIHSLAERRGRNVQWAEDAVRKSISATATQAKALNIIDIVAEDFEQLLKQLHGYQVQMGARTVILSTHNSRIKEFPMEWRLEALKAISDPNIAYVLMTIGMIGLMAELYNPGAILPGIVGAISLILAFYSLQSLPVNYAGVLLVLFGVVLFVLEITVTSYGLLAIGGVISMILGALFLMNEEFPFYQVSWSVIFPMIVLAAAFTLLIVNFGVKALRGRSRTGSEGMIGQIGFAHTPLSPSGTILVHGEIWNAMSTEPVGQGHRIEVTHIDGLTLRVKPFITSTKGGMI